MKHRPLDGHAGRTKLPPRIVEGDYIEQNVQFAVDKTSFPTFLRSLKLIAEEGCAK